jgi:hypothetical protein
MGTHLHPSRLIGTGIAAAVTTAAVVAATVGTATAAPPSFDVNVDQGSASGSYAAGEFCDVAVDWTDTWKATFKGRFDSDGTFVEGTVHGHDAATWTSEHGEVFKRRAWAGTYDPATDLFTVRGNQQNLHAGAGGVFVNDSGRTIVVDSTGELRFNAGPLEGFDRDLTDDICAQLES